MEVKDDNKIPEAKEQLITELARLYDLLMETLGIVNDCFSTLIAIYVAAILILNIFCLFEIYSLTTKHDQLSYGYCLINNLWNCFYTLFMICIVCACSLTTRQGQHTSVLLHKALHYENHQTVKRRVILLHFGSNSICEIIFSFCYRFDYFHNNLDTLQIHLCLVANCLTLIGHYFIR